MKKKNMNECINTFLKDCRQRLTEKTVKHYKTELKQFEKTFEGKNILEITKSDIRNYLNDLKKKKFARSTIENKLSIIKSFFDYLRIYHELKLPKLNDINVNGFPKSFGEDRRNKAIPKKDIRQMIEEAETLRDTLILSLLFYTGLRVDELSKIRLNDVNTKERTIRVTGKGNKPREVPYSKDLDRLVQCWMKNERKSYVHSKSNYFFPSKHKAFLTTRRIYDIVTKYAERAGIQKIIGKRGTGNTINRVHPHILRHSYATHSIADGIPLEHLKVLMGHSNIQTTMHYAGTTGVFNSYRNNFRGI